MYDTNFSFQYNKYLLKLRAHPSHSGWLIQPEVRHLRRLAPFTERSEAINQKVADVQAGAVRLMEGGIKRLTEKAFCLHTCFIKMRHYGVITLIPIHGALLVLCPSCETASTRRKLQSLRLIWKPARDENSSCRGGVVIGSRCFHKPCKLNV